MLIEFCGTPCSGKSSTIAGLRLNHGFASCRVIEESNLRSPFDDRNFELGILWTIFDTYAEANRISEVDVSSDDSLVIFDRGLVDRIAFARLLRVEDKRYMELADRAEGWLRESKQLRKFDRIFLFLTSFAKARERKMHSKLQQDSAFRVVNPSVIAALNGVYMDLFVELKKELPIVLIDDLNVDLSLEQKLALVKFHASGRR